MSWKKEIRFRGKRRNNKWVYGLLLKDGKGNYYIQTDDLKRYKVLPETIGQLILKTPKDLHKFGPSGDFEDFYEVYEGDILLVRSDFSYVDGYMGYMVKVGNKFIITCCESGYTLVPFDMYSTWDKRGRVFCQYKTMSNWQVWNNHLFFYPVGNIWDDWKPCAVNYFM